MSLFLVTLLFSTTKAILTDASWFYNSTTPLLFSDGSGQFPQSSVLSLSDAYLNGANFIQLTV